MESLRITARDGVALHAAWDEGPPGDAAVLVLPGYWRRAESPRIRLLAQDLARRFPVVTLDFRGHGRSSGSFTFGRLEHLDVLAALELMARRGVRRVALVGLSMGGASALVTLGSGGAPVELAGAAVVAAPADFGRIRPRPWRGRRDVAWADAWRIPRTEWRFPFTRKLRPVDHAAAIGAPVRLLHARADWLVDHAHGEELLRSCPTSELFLFEARGLHADELLGRTRDPLLRLVRPFVARLLQPPAAATAGEGEPVDPAPWAAALAGAIADPSRHSADLAGAAPAGQPAQLAAFTARDGVHLAFVSGGRAWWARGLRDGSVHGLNLLATQLVTDGLAWSEPLRRALAGALSPGPLRRFVVTTEGGGLRARPEE